MNGKRISQQAMYSSNSTMQTSFNVSGIAKGIYLVRLGNDQFQRVVKTSIQ